MDPPAHIPLFLKGCRSQPGGGGGGHCTCLQCCVSIAGPTCSTHHRRMQVGTWAQQLLGITQPVLLGDWAWVGGCSGGFPSHFQGPFCQHHTQPLHSSLHSSWLHKTACCVCFLWLCYVAGCRQQQLLHPGGSGAGLVWLQARVARAPGQVCSNHAGILADFANKYMQHSTGLHGRNTSSAVCM